MLSDVQQRPDERGVEIDQVGVSNVRYPLTLPLREGGEFNTVADLSMTVSLPHYQKGTHMSRFMIALNEQAHHFHPENVHIVLEELLTRLEAEEAYIDMTFPIFLDRKAPVSGESGLLASVQALTEELRRDFGPWIERSYPGWLDWARDKTWSRTAARPLS